MSALSVVVFLCLGSQFVSYVLCAPRLLIFQPNYFSLTYDDAMMNPMSWPYVCLASTLELLKSKGNEKGNSFYSLCLFMSRLYIACPSVSFHADPDLSYLSLNSWSLKVSC